MSRMMSHPFPALALAALLAAGCQSKNTGSVSEVPGPTPSTPITAANDPYLVQPAPGAGSSYAKPETTPSITLGAPATSGVSTATGNYTVRQGDTLWSIAAARYGSGQKWKDIVSANPGLTPEKMRVGQTIQLP